MRARSRGGRGLRALVAPLVMAGVLTGLGAGQALASACVNATGTTWKQVPSPSSGSNTNSLTGVAVVSSCQAWAVGDYLNANGPSHTLAEHWNGTAWTQVPSRDPGAFSNFLHGVAATSAANAWAVGDYTGSRGGPTLALIERWNGAAWKQAPSPEPSSSDNQLFSVAATAAANAWAVGSYASGSAEQTLIVRWNGAAWKRVPSPDPSASLNNELFGVAASSPDNAWAFGEFISPHTPGTGANTLIVHWNGTAWKRVPSPNPGMPGFATLSGMTVTSAANAWAVGGYINDSGNGKTLILHWTGTAWQQVPSPSPGPSALNGVAATSSTNIWAVGNTSSQTLAVHCC